VSCRVLPGRDDHARNFCATGTNTIARGMEHATLSQRAARSNNSPIRIVLGSVACALINGAYSLEKLVAVGFAGSSWRSRLHNIEDASLPPGVPPTSISDLSTPPGKLSANVHRSHLKNSSQPSCIECRCQLSFTCSLSPGLKFGFRKCSINSRFSKGAGRRIERSVLQPYRRAAFQELERFQLSISISSSTFVHRRLAICSTRIDTPLVLQAAGGIHSRHRQSALALWCRSLKASAMAFRRTIRKRGRSGSSRPRCRLSR